MYEMKVTDDYDNITFPNCSNIDKEDNIIIFKYLLLSIPSSVFLFPLISLMIYALIKPLRNNKRWRSFYIQLILIGV